MTDAPATDIEDDRELARIQAAATEQGAQLPPGQQGGEKAPPARKPGIYVPLITLDKEGKETGREEFRMADDVGAMALMEWAAAGDGSGDNSAFENLRAAYHVLEAVVDREQFPEFKKYARDHNVGFKELVDFQNASFEALSGNPTE
jgi:hypothetical protein